MNKKITICDIAEAAGVSSCSVSWVLRGHPRSKAMNAKTRQRILDAAARLGYVQNQVALAMRTGQVNTIALIVNFLKIQSNHSINQIIAGIMQEATARRYSIKIFDETKLEQAFRSIAENRIEKVISMSGESAIREKSAKLAEKYSIDLVFAYEYGHGRFPAVNTDNEEMTSRAVQYLNGLGHSRIGLLCVPHLTHHAEDRHAGYLRGMEMCRLKVDPGWISCSGDDEETFRRILAFPKRRRPTAFIAHSDLIATSAQRLAWKLGLRIPEDFSIIGIGDSEASQGAMVPITTFRETYPETGRIMVRLLFGEKPGSPPDQFNVYKTYAQLVERESVYDMMKDERGKRKEER